MYKLRKPGDFYTSPGLTCQGIVSIPREEWESERMIQDRRKERDEKDCVLPSV